MGKRFTNNNYKHNKNNGTRAIVNRAKFHTSLKASNSLDCALSLCDEGMYNPSISSANGYNNINMQVLTLQYMLMTYLPKTYELKDSFILCPQFSTWPHLKHSIPGIPWWNLANFELVRRKMKDLEERDRVRNFQPPITGDIIMKCYDLTPCAVIGEIKEVIKNAILDGEIHNDFAEAYALMERLAEERGLQKVCDVKPEPVSEEIQNSEFKIQN